MRYRILLAMLLWTPMLSACGIVLPTRDTGGAGTAAQAGAAALDTPDSRQHQAERMADLLLALARIAGRPYGTTGWAGGWRTCVTYTGHEVEFHGSGSFDAEIGGLHSRQAVVDAVRSAGWRITGERIGASNLSFDLVGGGARGSFSASRGFVEIEVAIDCMDVSAQDAQRLESAPTVDHT